MDFLARQSLLQQELSQLFNMKQQVDTRIVQIQGQLALLQEILAKEAPPQSTGDVT